MKTISLLLLAVFAATSIATLAAQSVRPRLQILNGSRQPIEIFWLKSDAERVSHGQVPPGKDLVITTTLGHRFLVAGESGNGQIVTSELPVQAFRFDPEREDGVPAFYTQSIRSGGFPIVASNRVNPYALKEAAYWVDRMLAHRPDVREAMIRSGARLCILAHNEFTTDLPEFAWLGREPMPGYDGVSGKDYWDARARGTGGSQTDPYCSCAEENVLGYPGDPYAAECILIHEFAHNIHLRGMVNIDPTFDERLKAAYDAAMAAGLWKGKYAAVNHHEYFAEGAQSWFDDNRENDHDHNHVDTRAELMEYDPGLAGLCREVFGDEPVSYSKPATRLTDHLAGYDPSTAPTFAWPDRLAEVKATIRARAMERDRLANSRQTMEVMGWPVHVHKDLLAQMPEETDKALGLLKAQLEEITRVVPAKAVAEMRKVPLYFSLPYPNTGPKAEYHPNEDWLRDHQRDPAMAKGVEFTNVRIFEEETRRMPNFALHELAHAYHDRVLGFSEARVIQAFENAKAAGKYEKVERRDAGGRIRLGRAYAMTNHKEYFAECTEAFFSRNDFYPYTRDELRDYDPEMFRVLEELWANPG